MHTMANAAGGLCILDCDVGRVILHNATSFLLNQSSHKHLIWTLFGTHLHIDAPTLQASPPSMRPLAMCNGSSAELVDTCPGYGDARAELELGAQSGAIRSDLGCHGVAVCGGEHRALS